MFSKYRNFFIFLAFAAGIFLGRFFTSFLFYFLCAAACFFFCWFFFFKRRIFASDLVLLLFFFFLGAADFCASSQKIPAQEGVFIVKTVSLTHCVKGRCFSNALLKGAIKEGKIYPLKIKVKLIDFSQKCRRYLATYKVNGVLSQRRFKKYRYYALFVRKKAAVEKFPDSAAVVFLRALTLKPYQKIKRYFPQIPAVFLAASILGRRNILPGFLKHIFSAAGIYHLLAISGLHVGLFAAVAFFILKLAGVKFRLRVIATVFLIGLYAAASGASASVLRAAFMFSLFGLSFLARRKVDTFNILGISGLIVLLFSPQQVFGASFLLSYTATFFLILGFRLFPSDSRFAFLRYFKILLFSSLFASLGTLPLVAYFFGRVYPLSWLYNLLLIPLFSLIVFSAFVFLLFPLRLISGYFAQSTAFFVNLFLFLAKKLGSLPFSSLNIRFCMAEVVIYYVAAALLLLFIAKKRKKGRQTTFYER